MTSNPSYAWREHAACNITNTDLFDPPNEATHPEHLRIERARTLCRRCPVTETCLADATTRGDSGIRAGLLLTDGRITADPNWPTDDDDRGGNYRPLVPCGTDSAYKRHRRRGEPIDDLCNRAHTEETAARRARARRRRRETAA